MAIHPSSKLGPIAKGYLTLYFISFEYFLVFGSVVATLAWLIQEHREASANSQSQRSRYVEMFWRVLLSPVIMALIFIVCAIFMYLPLCLGHIAQLALYGDYPADTVYIPDSLIYPFNWLHFLVHGR